MEGLTQGNEKSSQEIAAMEYLKAHEQRTSIQQRINYLGEELLKMRNMGSDTQFPEQYTEVEAQREELSAEYADLQSSMDRLFEKMTDDTRDKFLTVKIDIDGDEVMYHSDAVQRKVEKSS